jgi:uncharacterized membrane protein
VAGEGGAEVVSLGGDFVTILLAAKPQLAAKFYKYPIFVGLGWFCAVCMPILSLIFVIVLSLFLTYITYLAVLLQRRLRTFQGDILNA